MMSEPDLRAMCADAFAFSFFREFCRLQQVEETVCFVRAVSSFRDALDGEERTTVGLMIVKMFLIESSESEINVGQELKQPVLEAAKKKEMSVSVFDEVEKEVLQQLRQNLALFTSSAQFHRMQKERELLQSRMFGKEELKSFKEETPVQLFIHHAASKVLETLRNPFWWEREDAESTVAISKVGIGEADGLATISYERAVETRIGPLTFRNTFATTQWTEHESSVVMHFRDADSNKFNIVAQFFCTPVSKNCCVVIEKEFVKVNSTAAAWLAKLGAKKILEARRGHLVLLASKVASGIHRKNSDK